MRQLTWLRILWPSFLMAGLTSAIIFALVDPLDVYVFGYLQAERQVVYAVGFFLFWCTAAGSSALTLRLGLPEAEDERKPAADEADRSDCV